MPSPTPPMAGRRLTELPLSRHRCGLPGSFRSPSLPGHRSNEGMNRPTSRKGADPSSMLPRCSVLREPLVSSSDRSRVIVGSASFPCLLSARARCAGDLLLLSATRPDWTVSPRPHFRLVFAAPARCSLNHTACESESDSRRIRPAPYCLRDLPPACFAAAALAIGPTMANEASSPPTEMFWTTYVRGAGFPVPLH